MLPRHPQQRLAVMSDEHVKPATNAEAKVQVAGMLEIQDNKMCFDCPNRNPTWASLTFAVFLCEPCCGRHRGMGTHITFMRSVRLDEWEPEQAYRMSFGGNGPARKFFKQHGIMEVQDKYQTTAALQYRKQLDKLVKGKASTWETQKAESPVGSNSASPLSPDEASPSDTGMASPVMLSGEGASSPVQRRPNLASKKKGKGLGGAKKVESSEVKLATTATAVPEGFLPAQKKEVPKDEPIDLTQQAREREQQDNSANPYASLVCHSPRPLSCICSSGLPSHCITLLSHSKRTAAATASLPRAPAQAAAAAPARRTRRRRPTTPSPLRPRRRRAGVFRSLLHAPLVCLLCYLSTRAFTSSTSAQVLRNWQRCERGAERHHAGWRLCVPRLRGMCRCLVTAPIAAAHHTNIANTADGELVDGPGLQRLRVHAARAGREQRHGPDGRCPVCC